MILALDDITEFPLCWPPNKPRTGQRIASSFKTSMAKAQEHIRWEMPRWRARGWVISMAPQHRQGAVDPAVVLWWEHPIITDGKRTYDLRVIACDTYLRREDNLHAIGLTLERLRSLERYGTYSMEQAVEGARLALPAPPGQEPAVPWWEVLGVERKWPLAAIEAIWRSKAEKAHPDREGGSVEQMAALNAAMDAARAESNA